MFGYKKSGKKSRQHKERELRMEFLERRELLSINMACAADQSTQPVWVMSQASENIPMTASVQTESISMIDETSANLENALPISGVLYSSGIGARLYAGDKISIKVPNADSVWGKAGYMVLQIHSMTDASNAIVSLKEGTRSIGVGSDISTSKSAKISYSGDLITISYKQCAAGYHQLLNGMYAWIDEQYVTIKLNKSTRTAYYTMTDFGAAQSTFTYNSEPVVLRGATISDTTPRTGTKISVSVNPTTATGLKYQWSRSDTYTKLGTNISGATSKDYTLTSADVGKYLWCTVTGEVNSVSAMAFSAVKSSGNSVTPPAAQTELTGIFIATENPQVGSKITVVTTPIQATATFQWYYGNTANTCTTKIYGATQSSFTPNSTYANKYVKCVATGTGNSTGTKTSTAVKVTAATPAKTPLTSISLSTSAPKVGSSIKASVSPSGATATYQWYYGTSSNVCTTKIYGATQSSFTPNSTYANKYVKCIATGTGNSTGTKTSTAVKVTVATTRMTAQLGVGSVITFGNTTATMVGTQYRYDNLIEIQSISLVNQTQCKVLLDSGSSYWGNYTLSGNTFTFSYTHTGKQMKDVLQLSSLNGSTSFSGKLFRGTTFWCSVRGNCQISNQ